MFAFHRRFLIFFSIIVCTSSFATSFPERNCVLTLAASTPLPEKSAISRADFKKSVLLPDAPVKNQGSYGCCWISSPLGKWERYALAKYGRPIPLSENHLILASLFYRVEEALYYGEEIFMDGWQQTGDWMAKNIGFVPESAWTPKIDLREPKIGAELINYLNKEIVHYQDELAELKKAGVTAKAAWEFTERKKMELLSHLRSRVGNFPEKFIVDGKEFTPHAFAKSLNPDNVTWANIEMFPEEKRIPPQEIPATPLASLNLSLFKAFPEATALMPKGPHHPKDSAPFDPEAYRLFFRSTRDENYVFTQQPLVTMHEAVTETLLSGQPVYIGIPMVKEFYSNVTGVMSLGANGATPAAAAQAKFSGGHAMLITGEYRDSAGSLLGYRIQNSWGPKSGDIGYYYMDLDYFDTFVTSIIATVKKPAPKSP